MCIYIYKYTWKVSIKGGTPKENAIEADDLGVIIPISGNRPI